MSVYVVTSDQRLLQYDAPAGRTIWLRDASSNYKVFWKDCQCAKCNATEHETLIAWVEKSAIVSIGFERPFTVERRMLTPFEKAALQRIYEWLQKKKIPRRMDLEPLRLVSGEKKAENA